MTLTALTIVFGLAGILLLGMALRRLTSRHILRGIMNGLTSLALLALAAAVLFLGANLRTYQRLSAEQPAAELAFSRIGAHEFNGALSYANGEHATFALRGDEWQVDARILKWHALANLLGFDAAYRLERISGRYTRIEEERSEPRTVYALNPTGRADLWELARRYHSWIPWVDALYGSAAYLPMADGALYEITVSQSGLLARPLNQAARDAVGGWR